MNKYLDLIIKELVEIGIEKKLITLETKIKTLELDSLDLMQIIITNERKLNIIIPEEELKKVKTINDIVKLLEHYDKNKTNK